MKRRETRHRDFEDGAKGLEIMDADTGKKVDWE